MPIKNRLTERLGLSCPVIQAPLAGGGDTPMLVASVSEAGGFGFIGAAYLQPAQIIEAGRAVRARTARPYGVNLFAPRAAQHVEQRGAPPDVRMALDRVAAYYAELGLPAPAMPQEVPDAFDAQFQAALDCGAAAFSFTFGLIPQPVIDAIRHRGLYLMGTATTVEEARALEAAGVDAVVAQGAEAGGHRGSFLGSFEAGMVGTVALVPQMADALSIPVVASGGIMDGRGIAAALVLGASAVQLGTAFLTCDEAGIPEAYKQAILSAGEHQTRVTRAFSGRPARGIVNRFMNEVEPGGDTAAVLPFPLQNSLTRPLRTAAAQAGRAEFLSLWAGQGRGLARRLPAADLLRRLGEETAAALRKAQDGLPS